MTHWFASLPTLCLLLALPAQAQEDTDPDAIADDIIVTGRASKLYRVRETSIGKVPTDPIDIPQSVQVINAQMIEDQGAREITDLYRNVPGISASNYATVTARGFRADSVYYDGLRGDPFQGFSVPQLFTIDRVEFLKGPAGMLYGAGSPGGTINYVTKKPSDRFAGNVRGIIGTYDRIGGSADVTGPLDAAGRLSGRAALFYEDFDSYRANASSRTFIGDGGLTARIGDRTSLTVQATYYDQDLPGNRLRGIPVDQDGNFLTDRRWNHNEPTDFIRYTGIVTQARLETKLSEAISANLSGRWFRYREAQDYHEPLRPIDTDADGIRDTMLREFRWQRRQTEAVSIGGNLIGKARTGPLDHVVLAGGDWYRETATSRSRSTRAVPSLSLFDPVYGLTSGANYNIPGLPLSLGKATATRYGVYLQDQIGIGAHVILLGGVRRDWFEDRDRIAATRTQDGATTWRTGAIYKPRPDVSLYASWSDSFEPQATANQRTDAGGPFAPQSGNQIEVGAKTDLFGGRVQSGVALYRIVRANTLQIDDSKAPVNGIDQLAPLGEVTSKGVELTLTADVTRDWVVSANYAYNDARVTGTAPGQSLDSSVGDRFPNAPQHQAGFWTRYQVAAIDAAVAIGGQYVSSQIGRTAERVKPFTIFDATISKSLGFADAMVRVENIFDKYYAVSTFSNDKGAYVGKPRSVFVELRKRF
jgi:iron complex outermembrane receptor protein